LKARHRVVEIPASNLKKEMTKVLYQKGYIDNYKVDDTTKPGVIKIALKYGQSGKVPAILKIQRASKPGLRLFAGNKKIPRVLNGLGIAIMSTSHGVMSDKEAKKKKIGGEVLCYVY